MDHLELFESFRIYQLICESNVEFSPSFLSVLSKMDNELAKKIISLSGQDHKISTNYFDIPPHDKGNDLITFITDRKASELSAKITNEWEVVQLDRNLNNTADNAKYFQIFGMDVPPTINYPPVGTLGKIEQSWTSPQSGKVWVKFVPKNTEYTTIILNKEGLISHGPTEKIYYEENRQSTRIGRGIRSLLSSSGIKFTDKEIEEFVNKWKSTVDRINDIFFNFEVVTGSDIAKWYDYNNYESESGQLGNSCMKSVDEDYFDIYVNNPNVISMAIYKSPENQSKIRGRAILWKITDDKTFMDRIYTTRDSDIDLFKQYAKKMGWYSKLYNQSSPELYCISPENGNRIELGNPKISLSKAAYEYYPYMDTFKYYSPKSGIISNSPMEGCLVLESTDGHGDPWHSEMVWVEFYNDEFPEESLVWCEYAEVGWRVDSINGGNRLSEDCYFDDFYQVYIANDFRDNVMKECSRTGEYRLEKDLKKIYSTDNRKESKYVVKEYTGEDLFYSSYHGEFIPVDKAVEVWVIYPTSPTSHKEDKDWRSKDDGSWREVDGIKYDKGLLIENDINK